LKIIKIEKKKLSEEIAEKLRQMIQSGELQHGEKLDSVPNLANQFSVGKAAVREALSALKAVGLIEIKQGLGTFVKQPDQFSLPSLTLQGLVNIEKIKKIFEIRRILELGAARVAATNRTEADLLLLQHILEKMKQGINDKAVGEEADWEFHMAIAKASNNNYIVDMLNSISSTIRATMYDSRKLWLFSNNKTASQLMEEHEAILRAISEKNEIKVQQLMMEHLVGVEKGLIEFLRNKPR
jgi:GntR family transcriptional regulator, transcriptional repressor for pyruvate dehydrogenase complex